MMTAASFWLILLAILGSQTVAQETSDTTTDNWAHCAKSHVEAAIDAFLGMPEEAADAALKDCSKYESLALKALLAEGIPYEAATRRIYATRNGARRILEDRARKRASNPR